MKKLKGIIILMLIGMVFGLHKLVKDQGFEGLSIIIQPKYEKRYQLFNNREGVH